jgi:hypothetical protein
MNDFRLNDGKQFGLPQARGSGGLAFEAPRPALEKRAAGEQLRPLPGSRVESIQHTPKGRAFRFSGSSAKGNYVQSARCDSRTRNRDRLLQPMRASMNRG